MIDGLKARDATSVDLGDFFANGNKVEVTLRLLTPYEKEQLRELMMQGVKFEPVETQGARSKDNPGFAPLPLIEGSAQRRMKIRDQKLTWAVVEHTITEDGKPAEWNAKLWEALDAADPRILERVTEQVDVENKLNVETAEAANPT